VFAPAPAGAATVGAYVALGDSYAAAPLVPNQIVAAGLCLRSDHNYAHLLAGAIRPAAFRDASCSGAATTDMTQPQHLTVGSNAPQFDRLSAGTSLVTLEVGGNDIGFVSIVLHCISALPWGSPCRNKYVKGADDRIADAINAVAARLGAVLAGIHARAPRARMYVLGYPAILPDSGGGCWPKMPITSTDVAYLRAKEKQLNATIAAQALARGARYVDVYGPSIGHDACSAAATRWIEPIVPLHPAAPVHPNARGEQAMAGAVRAAIGA